MLDSIFITIFIGGLGLVFGSFVTALVGRLHDKQNFTTDRSRCLSCNHVLSPIELIPVFSWLLQAGKCRHCREVISWQYPVIELTMSFLFLVSLFVLDPDSGLEWLLFAIWLGQIVLLVALVVADLRYYLLPNNLVYPLFGLGVAYYGLQSVLATSAIDLLARISGVIFYAGIFYLLHHFSKGRWLGGGDVRLAFYLGLVGMPLALMSMFAASLLGSVVVLGLIALRVTKRETPIPFGPFLIAAHIMIVFFGQQILNWYLGFIGIAT